jgi:epoxyqueuosine reductase QueG
MSAASSRTADPKALIRDKALALGFDAVGFAPEEEPLANLARPSVGSISVYARNRDYHDIVKGMLKHLAQFIVGQFGEAVKVFVDTAPLMEKPLAGQAGLGWQGKHTNLVSRRHEDLRAPALAELAMFDNAAFRQRFVGSPIKRIGRNRFGRNVLIAIGNSGEPSLRPVAAEAACWALENLPRAAA